MCWCYEPEICEGHFCNTECDSCGYQDKVFERWENDERDEKREADKALSDMWK